MQNSTLSLTLLNPDQGASSAVPSSMGGIRGVPTGISKRLQTLEKRTQDILAGSDGVVSGELDRTR